MAEPHRILIVDDSALYRRILSTSVARMPLQTEVDTAPTGAIALKKIPTFRPDIVLLDIEMPEMSGIEVLKTIRRDFPEVTVVLVSGVNSRSADVTIEGLSSGAADFIPKPSGGSMEENTAELQRGLSDAFNLIATKRMAREARAVDKSRAASTERTPAQARPAMPPPRSMPSIIPPLIEVVGIGVSTGGPGALAIMIPAIPKILAVPMVIVQHMPPVFTESLARSLDRTSGLSVCEAKEGQLLERGNVYIAPCGIHMVVKRVTDQEQRRLMVRFDDGPPVNSCKPAVDVLFNSLARTSGGRTLSVVMTGMGQDGMEGVRAIKAQRGYCLTQNEETCIVYGMPQAVDQAGLSDESLPMNEMAGRIFSIINGAKS